MRKHEEPRQVDLSKLVIPTADDPPPSLPAVVEVLPPVLRQQGLPPASRAGNERDITLRRPIFAIFFGMIVPLLAVLVELAFRFSTDFAGINPLPTPWHVVLYLFIPASVAFSLLVQRNRIARLAPVAMCCNGIALIVALAFTLKMAPLLPVSLIALFALGFGLLGLSPLLALITTLRCVGYLRPFSPPSRSMIYGVAVIIGVLIFALLEAPALFTGHGMRLAAADNPQQRRTGIRLLRAIGDRQMLLRACYERPESGDRFFSGMTTPVLEADEARTLYYRVTGTPFNMEAVPESDRWRSRQSWWFNDNDSVLADQELGGAQVAGRVDGLSMSSSRIDGVVDAAAALAYTEWVMEFSNASSENQEARLQLALPAGGVVSRATLWVEGVEREAAFAANGHVVRAYRSLVNRPREQQRDPLLVTQYAPDRVLVQCFPVLPRSKMKIRLGITAPLLLTGKHYGILMLPQIVEQNYAETEELQHSLFLEGNRRLRSTQTRLKADNPQANVFGLRGNLRGSELATPLRVEHAGAPAAAWTPHPQRAGQAIQQHNTPAAASAPKHLIVVLDGSRSMRERLQELPALAALRGSEITILLAGDETETLLPRTRVGADFRQALVNIARKVKFTGGMDNLLALQAAWDLAAEEPNGAILWLCGPQPLAENLAGLQQRWQRRPQGPPLYVLPLAPGDNQVLHGLLKEPAVTVVPHVGSLGDDLRYLAARWGTPGTEAALVAQRRSVPLKEASGERTSAHLARLWAREQAAAFVARDTAQDIEMAIALGKTYHLVTPVTGAVVLETDTQYKDNDIDVPDNNAQQVPTVPEPEEWALIIMTVLMLAFLLWKGRKTPRAWAVN